MNENPYLNSTKEFFDKIVALRSVVYRLNNVFKKALNERENSSLYSGSLLVISDITGPTDNGWLKKFSTGSLHYVDSTFVEEVRFLLDIQCRHSIAQAYEALERLIKDLIHVKANRDPEIVASIKELNHINNNRLLYPNGENLFKLLKKICGEEIKSLSSDNTINLPIKLFWTVLSKVRHSITHNNSEIEKSDLFSSGENGEHKRLFCRYFDYVNKDKSILISLDQDKTNNLQTVISEVGYQLFKILSIKDGYSWEI